jgi:hypothetical protein
VIDAPERPPHPAPAAAAARRLEWLVFAASFLAFAYFHQGGGWNQNARFALVRAMVEERRFAIDSYLVYVGARSGSATRLERIPVRDGEFRVGDRTYGLWWRDLQGRGVSLTGSGALARRHEIAFVEPDQVSVTGDLAYHRGHFHPAKAPGVSFLAAPGYALVHAVERLAGADPDDWWTLTIAAWLTSLLSVGLLSALGCVLLFRLALEVSGGRVRASLLATLSFAFGTMFFPYATSLYEHDVIAVMLLASFYFLFRIRTSASSADPMPESRARSRAVLAGLCAGLAAVANYAMAVAVVMLGAYLLAAVRRPGAWRWFALGVLGPFLLLCAYNVACFGTPFTTNYRYEAPAFHTAGALLGVFVWPQWRVLPLVLISPFRGLFFSAPVLLLGVYGLVSWARHPRLRAEAWLAVSLLAFHLLLIVTFNGWHGGWAVGPRYLAPAVPFLALPAVHAFVRRLKPAIALATVSVAIGLLVTSVDPQAPVGVADWASIEGRPQWRHDPVTLWEWPLFADGRAWPILREQRDRAVRFQEETLEAHGVAPPERAQRARFLSGQIDAAIQEGEPAPLLVSRGPAGEPALALSNLSTISGPVSANPIGVYESWMYRVFPPGSREARLNSFNVGELLLGPTRWSLAPLVLLEGLLLALAFRAAADLDRRRPT